MLIIFSNCGIIKHIIQAKKVNILEGNRINSEKRLRAFTLAEMMVIMLILSVIMAASLPIITQRAKLSDILWEYNPNYSDIFYALGNVQSVIVGTSAFESSDPPSKLLVNSFNGAENHSILLKHNAVKAGLLDVKPSGFAGLGDYTLSSSVYSNGVTIGKGAIISGNNGIAIGKGANATTNNVAIGSAAVANNTGITAIGYRASVQNSAVEGFYNTSVGNDSAFSNTKGDYNTSIGYQAFYTSTEGSCNTSAGYQSGYKNGLGMYNTFTGSQSGYGNTSGSRNTAIGSAAAGLNTTGTDNITIGNNAGYSNTTGSYNVAMGYNAAFQNTSGTLAATPVVINGTSYTPSDSITAVGSHAAYSNAAGQYNTAVGNMALFASSGSENTAVGHQAAFLYNNAANPNGGITALGNKAAYNTNNLRSSTGGDFNTSIGSDAAFSNILGAWNTAIGYRAQYSGKGYGGIGSNYDNTAVGYLAGEDNDAIGNTLVGYQAGWRANSSFNTVVGYRSGERLNYDSTAIGSQAGYQGAYNIAIGVKASYANGVGDYNTAVGYEAGYRAGHYNTAIGHQAMKNTTGNSNTAIGQGSCNDLTSGYFKTCIGAGSQITPYNLTDGSERIFFGRTSHFNDGGAVLEVHNTMGTLNNPASTGTPTVVINGNLVVKGNKYGTTSTNGTVASAPSWLSSDRRLKNVSETFDLGLDKIRKLKVYNYTFKKDTKKTPRVGVIAQDLQKIFPDAITKDENGYLMIRQEDMFYAMVNSIKQLDSIIQNIAKDLQLITLKIKTATCKTANLVDINKISSDRIAKLKSQNKKLAEENHELKIQLNDINNRLNKIKS